MFADRRDAGRQLAGRLGRLAGETAIVVALPRGGVPVAVEVAAALGAPLELLTVRKLGAPQNPEMAVGAVAEDGTAVLDEEIARRLGMTQRQLDRVLEHEQDELQRQVECFRGRRPPPDVRGREVVVVDDGLATGLTVLVAVRALRGRGAARIVVAVPVGSAQAVEMLAEETEEVICLKIPPELFGVSRWYQDFSPVSDAQVLALLATVGTL